MEREGCPDKGELHRLHVGLLPGHRIPAVANHIAACTDCRLVVSRLQRQLDADPLLKALQRRSRSANFRDGPDCRKAVGLFKKTIRRSVGLTDASSDTFLRTDMPLRVGPYRILERLGRGGMGTVYRAVHTERGFSVALKIVRGPSVREPQVRHRFRRECELIRQLHHPRIVRVEESGEWEGVQFLAMELLDGVDVSQLVQRVGRLSIPDACEIVRQSALALQAAHQHGLIHRDVKPSNLMLTARGQVKLLDLGLARTEEQSVRSEELTLSGEVIGTVDYMAPEQAFDPRGADHRADLYSLGCLLYTLLSGRPPYGERFRYRLQKLLAHAQIPPEPLEQFRPEIPRPVAELTHRLLAKAPKDRPETAAEVARALEPFIRGHCIAEVARISRRDTNRRYSDSAPRRKSGARQSGEPVGPAHAPQPVLVEPPPTKESRPRVVGRDLADRRTRWQRLRQSPIRKLTAAVLLISAIAGSSVWYLASGSSHDDAGTLGTWSYPPDNDALSGLIPEPADLPGIGRWQVETIAPRGYVYGLSWSPDGRSLAVGSNDHRIRVYDSETGRLRRVFAGHTGHLPDLDFSPDGRWLASAGGWHDWSARLWSAETGAPGPVLSAEYSAVSVDWGPQGRRLAVLRHAPRAQVEVWDPVAAEVRKAFDHNDPKQLSVAWSPDGRRIASQGNRTLRIFNVSTGAQEALFENPQTLSGHHTKLLAWSPDSQRLAAAGEGNTLHLYDVAAEKLGPVLRGHSEAIKAVSWSPDGQWIATGGLDETIRIWNATKESPSRVLRHAWWVASLAWSPEGNRLASGSRNGTVRIWNPESGQLIREIGAKWPDVIRNAWSSVSFSPDGQRLATASADGQVRLWNSETGRLATVINAHEKAVRWVRFSPDGRRLASASFGPYGKVCVWEIATRREVIRVDIQVAGVGAFSRDGEQLAIPGNGAVRVIDAQTGTTIQTFHGHVDHVLTTAWSPDGHWLATGGTDGTVRLWAVQDGVPGPVLKAPQGKVRWLRWQSSSHRLLSIDVTQGQSSRLYIWRIVGSDGQLVKKQQLKPWCTSADVAGRSGALLATGHEDGIVHLRDPDDGIPEFTLPNHSGVIRSVQWDPAHRYLASAGDDSILCLWDRVQAKAHWLALLLPNGRAAPFSRTGELRLQDPAIEKELVYLVEQPSGTLELLSAEDFHSRIPEFSTDQLADR